MKKLILLASVSLTVASGIAAQKTNSVSVRSQDLRGRLHPAVGQVTLPVEGATRAPVMCTTWGVDKRQVTRFWISHSQVRILAPQPPRVAVATSSCRLRNG